MQRRALPIVMAVLVPVRLVFNTAQRFVYPFLPAIARGLGIPLEQAGLLVSARWISGMATPLMVQRIGRGERRRRLMVAGLLLMATGAVVTAATGVFVGALAGFILLGLAKPLYDVAAQAYVADRTPYARRARFMGMLEVTWGGGLLVGAPAAGWLIDRAGWEAPFWGIAALAGAALVAVGWAVEVDPSHGPERAIRLSLDRGGLALAGVFALFTFAAEVSFVVFGAWLEDGFGLSLIALGGAAVLIGVSEVSGEASTLVVTDRLGKRRTTAIGLVGCVAGYLLLIVTQGSLVGGLAAIAVAFFSFELAVVSAIPLASEVAPTARTRYLAVIVLAMGIGRAAGAALGPALFQWLGLTANALAAAAADGAALVVLWAMVAEHPTPVHPGDELVS